MNRRDFLRTAGGAAGGTAAASVSTGAAAAAEADGGGGGEPDLGGYLDGANGFDGDIVDETGTDQVTVSVGAGDTGLAFDPPAVHVDNGATVVWEWTGEGGAHNVVSEDGTFESGSPVAEAGTTFEYTFEEDGVYNYFCSPHKSAGMLGSIVVGTDYPTAGGGGGGAEEKEPHEMGVPFQPHFVGLATILMMVVSLIFTFFLLKYGESPHASGGND